MTASFIPHGLNEENLVLVEETIAGPIADDADATLTLPDDQLGKGLVPVAVACATENGGPAAVGARTWDLYASEALTGTGFSPVSFVEATGVLTVKNVSGAPLSNIKVTALFVPAGAL